MSHVIRFTVPSVPVAQPRQKHRQVGKFIQNYTPTKHPVNAFKASVQAAAHAVFRADKPLEGPISLTLVFILPRPQNKIWKTRPMPRLPHTSRPDFDNLEKAVTDSLSKLVWRDDSQIYNVHTQKLVASGDEQPHVLIEVYYEPL